MKDETITLGGDLNRGEGCPRVCRDRIIHGEGIVGKHTGMRQYPPYLSQGTVLPPLD